MLMVSPRVAVARQVSLLGSRARGGACEASHGIGPRDERLARQRCCVGEGTMSQLGTNISYDGAIPADKLQSLGVSVVRVVAKQELDDTSYFEQLNNAG